MDKIFSLFLKEFGQVYWINSGFILLNQGDAVKIIKKIDQYFPKFIKNGKLIKKTIGHYGDEILFTLASNSISKKNLIVQNKEISWKNIFNSRLLSFIWTVNTKQYDLRFLNPFKVSAHLHLPDLKISKDSQKFIKSTLLKFRPDYADFVLSMWVNLKILKNKIIIRILSNFKNIFFR
jgi:signal peptidase I